MASLGHNELMDYAVVPYRIICWNFWSIKSKVKVSEWAIKFNRLSGDSGQRGPYSKVKVTQDSPQWAEINTTLILACEEVIPIFHAHISLGLRQSEQNSSQSLSHNNPPIYFHTYYINKLWNDSPLKCLQTSAYIKNWLQFIGFEYQLYHNTNILPTHVHPHISIYEFINSFNLIEAKLTVTQVLMPVSLCWWLSMAQRILSLNSLSAIRTSFKENDFIAIAQCFKHFFLNNNRSFHIHLKHFCARKQVNKFKTKFKSV